MDDTVPIHVVLTFQCVRIARHVWQTLSFLMPFKLQAVHSKYAGMAARVGPDQEVMFQDRKITLDIPEEGITLTTGWMITPLTHPGVRLH